ncbi:MAG: hypothetical protein ACREBG_28920 [Pyrinomonadaceae bacterium]
MKTLLSINNLNGTRPLTQAVLTSPARGEGLNSTVNGAKERNVTGEGEKIGALQETTLIY